MDEKQLEIMNAAQNLFTQNGFQNTSINDVVKACKISKATYYKYFKSKEEMIIKIIHYADLKILETLRNLNADSQLSGREKLEKVIIAVWNQVFPKRKFIVFVDEHFSIEHKQQLMKDRQKYHFAILQEYRTSLIETFGEDIQSILWDLILCLDGLAREFVFAVHIYPKTIEPHTIARFIMEVLEAIVEKRKHLPGIIEESILYSVLKEKSDETVPSIEILFQQTLQKIKQTIEIANTSLSKEKLIEAVATINEEIKQTRYDSLLLEAMIALLEKEPALHNDCKLLHHYKSQFNKE